MRYNVIPGRLRLGVAVPARREGGRLPIPALIGARLLLDADGLRHGAVAVAIVLQHSSYIIGVYALKHSIKYNIVAN